MHCYPWDITEAANVSAEQARIRNHRPIGEAMGHRSSCARSDLDVVSSERESYLEPTQAKGTFQFEDFAERAGDAG